MKSLHLSKKSFVITCVVLALAVAAIGSLLYLQRGGATPNEKAPAVKASPISFDTAAAPGWRIGPGNETSRAAFYNDADCFVSLFRESETYDEATWMSELQKKFASDPSHAYTPGEPLSLELRTSDTPLDYTLYPFAVSKKDGSAADVYGGQAYGFIPLDDGHLFFQAYCDPTEAPLLPTAIRALEAFRFDQS